MDGRKVKENYHILQTSTRAVTHQTFCSTGSGDAFSREKAAEHEAESSLPNSAEIKDNRCDKISSMLAVLLSPDNKNACKVSEIRSNTPSKTQNFTI